MEVYYDKFVGGSGHIFVSWVRSEARQIQEWSYKHSLQMSASFEVCGGMNELVGVGWRRGMKGK